MPDIVRNIVYQFSLAMKQIFGNHLSKVIVFGSYARGDYRENSDVDVMVLVNLPEEEIKRRENDVYDIAFEIEISTGIDISPVIKSEGQYEYWADVLPFYKNDNFSESHSLRFREVIKIKKEGPQVLPRSQSSRVSET